MKERLLEQWRGWRSRFAALSERERAMVAVAAVAVVIYVGNALWLTPIYSRAQSFAKQTAQQEREFAKLQAQIAQLQADTAIDPNAALRGQLAEAEAQLREADRQLGDFEQTLVPPQRVAALLESLLRERRGVRLLSLKTLPAEALTAKTASGAAAADAPANAGETRPAEPALNIYRHGVELRLEGNYLDLVACLADLGDPTRQLLWQKASLKAGDDRKSTLTLVLYSLSLDKSWMAL